MIEIESLSKDYGPIKAVDDVTLSIEEGEVFGLIGPNGAGKTTLIKILVGLSRQTSGRIFIDGVRDGGRFKDVRRKIGYLPENVAFYENLTASETLRFFARLKGVPFEKYRGMLETVGLDAGEKKVKKFSKGMRQRLGLAVALLGDPRILIFDEPTSGLDPRGVREFQRMIKNLKEEGVTVVLSSHILGEVQEVVDRIGIMNNGRIIASGSFRELLETVGLRCIITATLSIPDESVVEEMLNAAAEEAFLDGARLKITCANRDMAKILAGLAGVKLKDLEIKEPSLEDVFLKYIEEKREGGGSQWP